MSYKDFFKGKRIAVVGCGQHGSMLGDIKFLIKLKAHVSVYETRSAERLGRIADELETMLLSGGLAGKLISCTFNVLSAPVTPDSISIEAASEAVQAVDDVVATGAEINSESFFSKQLASMDLIILAPDVAKSSLFLKLAMEKGVRIEYPDVLFFKLIPPTTLIGVMGSVGKTATTSIIFDIIQHSFGEEGVVASGHGLFMIDVETTGALSTLKKVKKDDIIIVRMPEHLMHEYRNARIVPHMAVITHVSAPLADQGKRFFGILELQTYNSFIIASDQTIDTLKKQEGLQLKAKMIRTRTSTVPESWKIDFVGKHARDNAGLALETALLFKIPKETIEIALLETRTLRGRIELVKKGPKSVDFYNDSASVRPESTLAALRSLAGKGDKKNVVLIFGGAYTGASYDELFSTMSMYTSRVIVLPGSGTLSERWRFGKLEGTLDGVEVWHAPNIAHAVKIAKDIAEPGDKVLFSPAFDSMGVHESRADRGEAFVKAVKTVSA